MVNHLPKCRQKPQVLQPEARIKKLYRIFAFIQAINSSTVEHSITTKNLR